MVTDYPAAAMRVHPREPAAIRCAAVSIAAAAVGLAEPAAAFYPSELALADETDR